MAELRTVKRVVFGIAAAFFAVQFAHAESVLNFPIRPAFEITITNTASVIADIQFTLYGADGNPVAGPTNPVSYRIGSGAQLSMSPAEIFPGTPVAGWIQANSSTSSVEGFAIYGTSAASVKGLNGSLPALKDQVISYLPRDRSAARTSVVLTNPGAEPAAWTATFYSPSGVPVGQQRGTLGAHAQAAIPASGNAVRVAASEDILAVAAVEKADSLLLVNGQDALRPAQDYVAPFFGNRFGGAPVLLLTNTSPAVVEAAVTFHSGSGNPSVRTLSLPANGSVAADWVSLTGLAASQAAEGWLSISSSAPGGLVGHVLLGGGHLRTSVALQPAGVEAMLFSHAVENTEVHTRLAVANRWQTDVTVTVTLCTADGAAVAQQEVLLPAMRELSFGAAEVFPQAPAWNGGFLTIRSALPVHAVGFLQAEGPASLGAVVPQFLNPNFLPHAAAIPAIQQVTTADGVLRSGAQLFMRVENVAKDATLIIGGQTVPIRLEKPGAVAAAAAELPPLEPGLISVQVRTGGVESNRVAVGVYSNDGSLTETMSGYAFYQKLQVTDGGLQLTAAVMVPIRNARVEILDRVSQLVISVSETDDKGRFHAAVPPGRAVLVRVVSRLRYQDLKVLDNTAGNQPYAIAREVDLRDPRQPVALVDTSSVSGAFNILEMLQRANELVATADAVLVPPPVTIYWSEKNTNRLGNIRDGLVGTTFFDLASKTAYVLGDRGSDSDEFDDSVILHEYAHMLSANSSRDDSPGGGHGLGDLLDPRVAWSEGWADFFSAAVLGSPIYRDSKGPSGGIGVRYDLEDNVPLGDRPGYRSEASVGSLLWDLFDENQDAMDAAEFPFVSLWTPFTELRNNRFVYLPYFLERFLARNTTFADSLRPMLQARSIEFQSDVRLSTTNPFPRVLVSGKVERGQVDSLTPRRTNLAQSAHFFSFTTTGGAASIRLDVEGLGPANNPGFNDLDLFLLDANGTVLERQDGGVSGESESIVTSLLPGTYVVEIRSFYARSGSSVPVFNSGQYSLSAQFPK